MPNLPSWDNYRLFDGTTQAIQLPINKIRARNWGITSSLGCQPCAGRLTSPRRLILTSESKNTNKNKEEGNSNAEIHGLRTRMWGFTNWWWKKCSWQINPSKILTLIVWRILFVKTLGSRKNPLYSPLIGSNMIQDPKTKWQHRNARIEPVCVIVRCWVF